MTASHRCPYCERIICRCEIGLRFFELTAPPPKKRKKDKRRKKGRKR